MTLRGAVSELITNPRRVLIEKWNWKTAILSAALRATLFLFANLTAGWRAATGAMLAEFLYAAALSGFYGAITQVFSEAEPQWAAALSAAVLLPAAPHAVELTVHFLRGTPNIKTSLIASGGFTIISTLFNLYAMRRGALVVGATGNPIIADLRRMPRLLGGFLAAGPLALCRAAAVQSARVMRYWRIAQTTPAASNSTSVLQGAKGQAET